MSDNGTTTPIPPVPPKPGSEPDATEVLFPGIAGEPQSDAGAAQWNTEPRPSTALPARPRRHARFGTILWGVILLVFAAFMVTNAIVPFVLDAGTWIIGALVAAGVVLVVAGIAAAVRRTD